MTLIDRMKELICACFTGIWIESPEHTEVLADMQRLAQEEQWRLMHWDLDLGLQGSIASDFNESAADPLTALRSLGQLGTRDGTTILVLKNFHRFLASAEIVQSLVTAIHRGKLDRTFVVILSPVVQLPVELEKLFTVIEHARPDREQLADIARGIATEAEELPSGNELTALLDAAAGLTRYEAENAFSLSLVRDGRLTPQAVWELKTAALKKSGLLKLHRGSDQFEQLGGLEALKAFCRRSLLRSSASRAEVRAKGVLLLGVPGVGKSAFCKALGQETGRPTLTLDVGALMGSLVGQTESNIREALAIADAMSPCILFVDEVEKALSGASGGAQDSGVSTRLFGTLLTWMNDHTSNVFMVATCNDVSKLPPEFTRAERFDGVFFLDLPSGDQRAAIWQIHLREFSLDNDQDRPQDDLWTGAEIRACCRLAALLDVPLTDAAHHVVPVAVTACESVEKLRSWADGRCLSVDHPGVYQRVQGKRRRRSVMSKPSDN
ncbi:AAA family ATPase [Roseimaritima ulvae]|uniref:Uncharacterized AAA domain-containing protein ycf46 n=1 Tax=Roseimaritima ulvae TaxID=980254 RepID=A0A5B9QQR3_9BACT|nr:AAA family ATPase [Roseimaritima ulvae]QEG41334.1 ATP-dependent zinc metalloprotease FtsH 3 [Roseimaritima ulvae]